MAAACIFAALSFALWKPTGQLRVIAYAASGLCFAAALLCKESALIYTPLLVLCAASAPGDDAQGIGGRLRVHSIPIGVGVVITGAYAVLRSTVLSFGSDSSSRGLSFVEHMGEVFGAFAVYMKLAVLPTGLHMERVLDAQPLWQVLAGMLLLALVCGAALMAARAGRRRIAGGLGWFLLTWLPISGIFPLNAPMAEHWLYVPIAGLLWAAAEVVWPYISRRGMVRVAGAAVAVVVIALTAVSVDRNRDWRDNQTIYAATLEENPDTIRVNYNLAVTYEDIVDNPIGAQRHFKRVLELYEDKRAAEGTPEDAVWADELDARLSLGRLFLDEALFGSALGHFVSLTQDASKANAGDVAARAAMGLAIAYVATGQIPQGIDLVQRIAQTNQLQSASAYYRRTFAGNQRVSDEMQSIVVRVTAMQQAQQAGSDAQSPRPEPIG